MQAIENKALRVPLGSEQTSFHKITQLVVSLIN